MSLSTTWQELPDNLLALVLMQEISLAEAAELWDEYLQTADNETRPLPVRLHQAASKVHLLALEARPTQH